jgi:hypothetical protein
MENQIIKHEPQTQSLSVFANGEAFEHAQRIAKMLSSSDLVPQSYKGNVANTLVALEMAHRLGDSPLMVMQNMNVIHGKPSWGSSYIIAKLNSCGRFNPIKFRAFGEGDGLTVIAWTNDVRTNELLEGPPISIAMAKKEGWYTKNGSKWPTMPDLMLRYRAAAFFGRLYAPELMMGMHTSEEVYDMVPSTNHVVQPNAIAELNQAATTIEKKPRKNAAAKVEVPQPEAHVASIPHESTPTAVDDNELI